MPARLALSIALLVASSCGTPRDDRHALLDAIDRAHDAVAASRRDPRAARAAVGALEEVRVREGLAPTRDRCAELYAALLAHEESSAEATELLDRYERMPRGEWPEDAAARMRGAYAAAEEATARAGRARPECERLRAALREEITIGRP